MERSRSERGRQILRTARRLVRDAARGYLLQIRGNRNVSPAGIPVGADERRAQIARMGTSLGARVGAARLRSIGASEERRQRIREESALRSAQEVLQVMGNMKGAVMKIAQMASFAIDGLPPGISEQLAQLQTAAPPMTYELVSEVVTSELGDPPEKVFSFFEREPIAAASIGQVHRAISHDGRDVAVKVQYPGVDEAIKADLANADLLFSTIATLFGGFDPRALLEEVVARLTEEFDYRKEAANQQWFADRYREHSFVKVPDVLHDLSATRVITSELVRGRGFYEVLADSQDSRDRYGEIIFRFAFSSALVDGMFSGDPHPGNYIFMEEGRICFLDFGLVKRFESPEQRDQVRATPKAIVSGDRERLVTALRDLGVLVREEAIEPERLWSFFSIMFGSIVHDAPRRYTRQLVGDAVRQVVLPDSAYSDVQATLQFPAMLAIFQRYMLGTAAVLGHLEAEANWHRIMRELLLDEGPSSDIGRLW